MRSNRLAWIGIVLVLQSAAAVWVFRHDPARIRTPDSSTYEEPARALLEDGRFWTAPQSTVAEIKRTPGYPALLAGVYAIFGERRAAVIGLQILMNCAIIALVWRIASRTGAAAGWLAALFLGLDLPFLTCGLYLLTETFFTLLLLLFAAAWLELDDHLPGALLAGSCLSAAALTRPIAYYLVPLVAAGSMLVSRARGRPWRRATGYALVLLLPFVVLCGGWQLRNRLVSGSAEFSQIKSVNLLRWRAAGIVALRDGIPFEAAQDQLEREIERAHPDARGAARYALYSAEGRRIIRSEPRLFVRTAVVGLATMMLVPGEYVLLHVLGVDHESSPAGDVVRLPFAQFLRTWPLGRPWAFGLFVFVFLHLAALYVCGAAALWRLPRLPPAERSIVLLAVALIVYFAALSSGPEAYPRFRAPLAPFLALLAGIGAARLGAGSIVDRVRRVGAPQVVGGR